METEKEKFENIVRLVAKLADYEAEINELENLILDNLDSSKVPLYKKDLTILRAKHTKTKNELNRIIEKENIHAK